MIPLFVSAKNINSFIDKIILAGASKSTETEMDDMVQKPELHKLKTKIQDVFNNATKDNSPLMVNLPVRAKVVTEELIRKLVACANLLTVEGDAEEEFWETEFKKTVIKKAPIPSCRPISIFKQVKRKAIRLYKNPQKAIAKKAAKALKKLRSVFHDSYCLSNNQRHTVCHILYYSISQ